MTGSLNAAWTVDKATGSGLNAFAGNWSGTYWGSEAGTWQGVGRTDGTLIATAQSPSVGTVNLTGTVAPAGSVMLYGSGSGIGGPFTITWEGVFYSQGADFVGTGTWSSTSGYYGDWSGHRE
jgi:hypothetical protein